MITMEENRISLQYEKGSVVVNGASLVVKKLMDEEILIVGNISSIEFR